MTKLLNLQNQRRRKTNSSVSGSSRRDLKGSEYSEQQDTSILDTLEIDDLIRAPNLLNVMTIRSIPLQKRDARFKIG